MASTLTSHDMDWIREICSGSVTAAAQLLASKVAARFQELEERFTLLDFALEELNSLKQMIESNVDSWANSVEKFKLVIDENMKLNDRIMQLETIVHENNSCCKVGELQIISLGKLLKLEQKQVISLYTALGFSCDASEQTARVGLRDICLYDMLGLKEHDADDDWLSWLGAYSGGIKLPPVPTVSPPSVPIELYDLLGLSTNVSRDASHEIACNSLDADSVYWFSLQESMQTAQFEDEFSAILSRRREKEIPMHVNLVQDGQNEFSVEFGTILARPLAIVDHNDEDEYWSHLLQTIGTHEFSVEFGAILAMPQTNVEDYFVWAHPSTGTPKDLTSLHGQDLSRSICSRPHLTSEASTASASKVNLYSNPSPHRGVHGRECSSEKSESASVDVFASNVSGNAFRAFSIRNRGFTRTKIDRARKG